MHVNLDDIFEKGRREYKATSYFTSNEKIQDDKGARSRSVLRSKDHFRAGPTWFIKVVVSRKKLVTT